MTRLTGFFGAALDRVVLVTTGVLANSVAPCWACEAAEAVEGERLRVDPHRDVLEAQVALLALLRGGEVHDGGHHDLGQREYGTGLNTV